MTLGAASNQRAKARREGETARGRTQPMEMAPANEKGFEFIGDETVSREQRIVNGPDDDERERNRAYE